MIVLYNENRNIPAPESPTAKIMPSETSLMNESYYTAQREKFAQNGLKVACLRHPQCSRRGNPTGTRVMQPSNCSAPILVLETIARGAFFISQVLCCPIKCTNGSMTSDYQYVKWKLTVGSKDMSYTTGRCTRKTSGRASLVAKFSFS